LYEVGEESLGVAFKASRQHDCGFKKRWSSDTEAGAETSFDDRVSCSGS
jgi:hypothetical protein